MIDLFLKNGKVVFPDGVRETNIGIKNGKITLGNGEAKEVIDCAGLYILPGLIDAHVHMRTPGLTHKEDFKTGSFACAAGGITAFLDMPNTVPATVSFDALEKKKRLAEQDSIVNFGFFVGATGDNLNEIKRVKNIAGVKVYFGAHYKDISVKDKSVLEELFKWGGAQIVVHAESEKGPYEAVKQVLHLTKKYNARVHIAHVSSREEIEEIKKFKTGKVTCETAPYYLFLTENFAKVNPRISGLGDQNALWRAIDEGVIDIIATDHAPHLKGEKGKSFAKAPAGVPGVETALPLMLNAVNEGRIDLMKVVKLMCENPARIFSIKNKGKIAEGFDADLVVVDMGMCRRVENQKLFTKCGWSPFDGWELKGWSKMTIVNGVKVFEDGKIIAGDFRGKEVRFL